MEPEIEVNPHSGLGTSLQDLGLTLPAGLTTREVRRTRLEPELREDPPAESPKRRKKP